MGIDVVRGIVAKSKTTLKSSSGMPHSGFQALQADPDVAPGAAVPFQFELSWRSLTQPEAPSAPAVRIPEPAQDSIAHRVLALATKGRQWMTTVLQFVRQRVTAASLSVEPQAQTLPGLSFAITTDRASFRTWAALWAFALLLVTLAVAAVRRMEQPSAPPAETPKATVQMGEAGWIAEWVTDPVGSSRGRQISLYRPSLPMSDYRLEFGGRIERKSLGWAFRRADSRNYYVAKLEASRPGGAVNLIRYGVVRGVEDRHIQIPLAGVSSSGPLKVRLDAKRSRFTIYVQDQVVADWEDARLKTGGVGFLSERDERAQVQAVQISF